MPVVWVSMYHIATNNWYKYAIGTVCLWYGYECTKLQQIVVGIYTVFCDRRVTVQLYVYVYYYYYQY